MEFPLNIGQAAKASGISAKMIRYYESSGLLPAAIRRTSGYRDYGTADVHRLRFVRRARDLGFSMERIRGLLSLWNDRNKGNAEIRKVAGAHIEELKSQAANLEHIISTLEHLVSSCRSEDRDHCPIIADLGGGAFEGTRLQEGARKGRSAL